jgi:hypothetical protein
MALRRAPKVVWAVALCMWALIAACGARPIADVEGPRRALAAIDVTRAPPPPTPPQQGGGLQQLQWTMTLANTCDQNVTVFIAYALSDERNAPGGEQCQSKYNVVDPDATFCAEYPCELPAHAPHPPGMQPPLPGFQPPFPTHAPAKCRARVQRLLLLFVSCGVGECGGAGQAVVYTDSLVLGPVHALSLHEVCRGRLPGCCQRPPPPLPVCRPPSRLRVARPPCGSTLLPSSIWFGACCGPAGRQPLRRFLRAPRAAVAALR